MTKFHQDVCNVVVITEPAPEVFGEVLELYEGSMGIFAKQKGFIGGTVLKSIDTDKIISVLQWKTKGDHLACLTSADWQTLPSSARWFELIKSGKLKTTHEVCAVLTQSHH